MLSWRRLLINLKIAVTDLHFRGSIFGVPDTDFAILIRSPCSLFRISYGSLLIRLPLPQCFCPRGRKLRPWSEKNSDQNSDHPRLSIYWGKEKLRPWSEFLGRENSDHGLSFGHFWGRGRLGGSQRLWLPKPTLTLMIFN